MRVGALVPFKRFTRAKKRLRTFYDDAQVEQLLRAMLRDVLEALSAAPSLAGVSVLTDDAAVAEVARRAGAQVRLRDPDPGLNPAIEAGARELREQGFDAALVVLGDLPLLQTADVEKVLSAGRETPVVIVPSGDAGTALLFTRPPLCIPPRFGVASAEAHRRAAAEAGLDSLVISELEHGAALDLDTPEDARAVLSSERASRTRDLLRSYQA